MNGYVRKAEPGPEWVGKTIIVSFEVKVGDLVRVDEHGDKLVVRPLEPWERARDGTPIFRAEEGLAPGQIRIRRIRNK